MLYKSSCVKIGNDMCQVNVTIKKVAEEISALENRLENMSDELTEEQQELEDSIYKMIKMRCEILGGLSEVMQ
ncbi:MAG: hypothetical protein COB04_14420 [Gammaproteobacteria bacterium]|nr:MAG: hypothetical protein COB04_14420 [Gammaproteobacteria bacterium]